MSMALAIAFAALTNVEPSCSWNKPGANRYRGGIGAAIDRYVDIPDQVRATLKRRMAEDQPDDRVRITRDAITGRNQYGPQIRDMHFGAASLCRTVSRSGWSVRRGESAKVFCVGQHCILVPKICGNVSRISRIEPEQQQAAHHGAPPPSAVAGGGAPGRDGAAPPSAPAAGPQGGPQAVATEADSGESVPTLPGAGVSLAGGGDGAATQTSMQVVAADGDDAARDRLYGRGGANWTTDVGGWQNTGGGGGGGGGGTTDPGTPPPVPEPETWAMLAAGLGVIAMAARRRATRRVR